MDEVNPGSERIQEVAREVISRSHYHLESEGPSNQQAAYILRLMKEIIEWLAGKLQVLFDISPILGLIVVIVLVAIVVAVLVQMVMFVISIIKDRNPSHRPVEIENVFRPNPESWEALAEKASNTGDYLEAVRSLFMAMIARLELRQGKPFRRGMTSREVSRRFEKSQLHESIKTIVRTHEITWFGFADCLEGDFQNVREEYDRLTARIRSQILEKSHVDRP